jgi:hypothetical protein
MRILVMPLQKILFMYSMYMYSPFTPFKAMHFKNYLSFDNKNVDTW